MHRVEVARTFRDSCFGVRRSPQLAQIDLGRFKHKNIVVLILSLELQLQQLLLQPASHLHRPTLRLDVPALAFVWSERDDLVSKVNIFPAHVIQQGAPSGYSVHCRNEHRFFSLIFLITMSPERATRLSRAACAGTTFRTPFIFVS
jgi:hypothetical protein